MPAGTSPGSSPAAPSWPASSWTPSWPPASNPQLIHLSTLVHGAQNPTC
jgi:hypothetical protein